MLVATSDKFSEVMTLLTTLPPASPLAIDTETNGLRAYRRDRLVGVSVYSPTLAQGWYFSFRHGEGDNLSIDCLRDLGLWLADKHWVMFNAKFDMHMLAADGYELSDRIEDVMLMAHLLNENEALSNGAVKGAYGLKRLARKYLGVEAGAGEDALFATLTEKFGKKAKGEMWRLPAADVAFYAVEDARLTWELREFYRPALEKWGQWELYLERCEFMRLFLFPAEQHGFPFNLPTAQDYRDNDLRSTIDNIAAKYAPVNLNSPKQVTDLFRANHINVTDTRKATLTSMALKGNEVARGIAGDILAYRKAIKIINLYIDKYEELIGHDGRLHPSFNMIGTETGRLSCFDPNLQQVPKDGELKHFFYAPPGWVIVQLDYSNMEYRLAAHYAHYDTMRDLFNAGADMHQYTADQLSDLLGRKVSRHEGKTANFSLLYGTGPETAAARWDTPLKDAYKIVMGWREVHAPIYVAYRSYAEEAQRYFHADGTPGGKFQYVRLFNGRTRKYHEYRKLGLEAPYKDAWNALIQGTGAAITEASALKIAREFEGDPRVVPLNEVHDSVMLLVREDNLRSVVERCQSIMQNWPEFDPKLTVDVAVGYTWGEMRGYQDWFDTK